MPTLNLFELLILGCFATYRLTQLIVDEAGPFNMFGKFRYWAGVRYDEHSRRTALNQFAEGLNCFYCSSVWVGIGVGAIIIASMAVTPLNWLWLILVPFSLSGGAVFMKKWAG